MERSSTGSDLFSARYTAPLRVKRPFLSFLGYFEVLLLLLLLLPAVVSPDFLKMFLGCCDV